MTFCVIDRRNWKVVAKASKKAKLPKQANGLIVDTTHLDRLPNDEILALYSHVAHGEPVPAWVVAQIKQELEKKNGVTSAPIPEAIPVGKGAVAQARAIFVKMKNAKRKEIIAACVAKGINKNTAGTQYWKWKAGK